MRNKRLILLLGCAGFAMLMLTGCDKSDFTDGSWLSAMWTPVVAVWEWLWETFTPGFWDFVDNVWDLPDGLNWVVGIVAYALSALLFVGIAILCLIVLLILGVFTGVAWVVMAIIEAIF